MAISKEEQRRRYGERKEKEKHQEIYRKILEGEMFTVSEVAKLFGKKTSTIRRWEREGVIPKVKKYAKNEEFEGNPLYTRRKYTIEELYEVITGVLNKDWIYETINREELEKIQKYIALQMEISSTRRTRSAW